MKTILVEPIDKKRVVDLDSTLFYEKTVGVNVELEDNAEYHHLSIRGDTFLLLLANNLYMTSEQLKQYAINNYLKVIDAKNLKAYNKE